MANKKSNKKGTQQASKPAKGAAASQAADKKAKQVEKGKAAKAQTKAKQTKDAKKAKNAKPGFFERAKKYLGSVRTEMRRVTWPSKKELVNYSVAVCASLVVVGIAIAVFDMVISEGLALFAGLRG